jgi:hypothetical protein
MRKQIPLTALAALWTPTRYVKHARDVRLKRLIGKSGKRR